MQSRVNIEKKRKEKKPALSVKVKTSSNYVHAEIDLWAKISPSIAIDYIVKYKKIVFPFLESYCINGT